MIQTYMEKVEEAVRLGYDLRGVMYWSLVDNFEWALGYGMKFGMYEFVPGGDQSRRLRPSGALLATWFARLVARCPGLAAAWRRGTEGKRPSALAPN
jgi:beta-glucosidase/6-phospho-beta-glucosidase/beta-galactosidase